MEIHIAILITAVAILALVIIAVAVFFVVRTALRKSRRLQRAYDLVVVQVLIPKSSQDKDGGEQTSQQIQESIAKTEAFFSTVGGLRAERGLRAWFTGRSDHFSFEIVTVGGHIKFFVAVPRAFQSYIEEQLTAQIPDAYIEEARDYNIFSPTGTIATSTLTFRRSSVLPIKTYKRMEVDPVEGLTNAMSKVRQDEGIAIQVIVRSAVGTWRRRGVKIASAMQQGKSLSEAMSSGFWKSVRGWFELFKSSEDQRPEKDYRLSPMEEETVKGVEEKASRAGFDVNIRIVASAADSVRTKSVLDSVTQAFTQYSTYQYGNEFVAGGASTKQKVITQFIHRVFDERKRLLLNTEELASLWHLPLPTTETPNIQWLVARRVSPPVNMPTEGLILGDATYRGKKTVVRLQDVDRQRHMYIIGGTGVGKSTLMEELAMQDIAAGHGLAIIDPHGSFVENILPCIPKERADDVVLFDPSDVERPVGLNMLEAKTPEEADFVTQEMISIFYKLVSDPQMIGPMFEHYMRNAMLTLMSDPENPGTIVEIPRILTDESFQKLKLKTVTDPILRAFWEKELPQTSSQTKGEMLPYLVSKIGRFIENTMVRNIIGQQKSGLNFRQIMDEGKILLVNLSKGKVGEMNAKLLGLICVTKLQVAALARADMAEKDRKDFYLYIDEFQNFVTDSIATILAEARKYRLNLIMAHQYIAQLVQNNDSSVRDAVFGNVGTVVSFRIGVDDAEVLAKQLGPPVTEFDVLNIEKYNAYLRLMIDNTAQRPFNFKVPHHPCANDKIVDAIKQLSRLKHGRDRSLVEADIMERSQLA